MIEVSDVGWSWGLAMEIQSKDPCFTRYMAIHTRISLQKQTDYCNQKSLLTSLTAALPPPTTGASRGLVTVSVAGNRGSMIELNSETYVLGGVA